MVCGVIFHNGPLQIGSALPSMPHQRPDDAVDLLAEAVVFADFEDDSSVDAIRTALAGVSAAASGSMSSELKAALDSVEALVGAAVVTAQTDPDAARARLGAVVSTINVLISREATPCDVHEVEAVNGVEPVDGEKPIDIDGDFEGSDAAELTGTAAPDAFEPDNPFVADAGPEYALESFLADDELTSDFVVRSLEHMAEAEEALIHLESDPLDAEFVNLVLAAFHTVKGMAGFLQLATIESHAHDAETVLAAYRDTTDPVPSGVTAAMLRAVDSMRDLVVPLCPSAGTPAGAGTAVPSSEDIAAPRARGRKETIRVDAARFDQLLDAIGELVIAESSASRLTAEAADPLLIARQMESLDKITRSLQEMATLLRMVDLDETFRRMQRVVRDVAQRQGRAVEFSSEGEDTRLDKTIVDAISDPLVHLLRNAVDHGLTETASERAEAGKREFGRVHLRAFHRGGSVFIEVEDDGRGLDKDAILARAIERGLVAPGEALSDRAIFNLVFHPGFTTRDEVTDVSGRGVGMDVVTRTVEALRGSVEVRSEQGQGTVVSLRLPLTLAIIDGMLVRCGDERYVVPTLSVIRSVRPAAGDVVGVLGEAEMLRRPEGVMRLVRLSELLGVPGAVTDPERAIAVVLEDDGQQFALLADELLGKQQVVIKPLTGPVALSPCISGASVMADGTAGLILDIAGLVRMSGAVGRRDDRA